MSKFDTILKRIEEQMPNMQQMGGQPKPPVTNQPQQQQQFDQKIVAELVAAKTPEQVQMALQKLQATQQQAQQKTATPNTATQPAV